MGSLHDLILTHWKEHHPKMLLQFRQERRLDWELEKTLGKIVDLLHELVVIQKMSYPEAKKRAINRILLSGLTEDSSLTIQRRNENPPATSE